MDTHENTIQEINNLCEINTQNYNLDNIIKGEYFLIDVIIYGKSGNSMCIMSMSIHYYNPTFQYKIEIYFSLNTIKYFSSNSQTELNKILQNICKCPLVISSNCLIMTFEDSLPEESKKNHGHIICDTEMSSIFEFFDESKIELLAMKIQYYFCHYCIPEIINKQFLIE